MINSSGFCQDLIRRFDEIDASYSASNVDSSNSPPSNLKKNNLDNDSFFMKFNDIYHTNFTKYDEILNYLTKIDPRTKQFEIENIKLNNENKELKLEINRLNGKCKAFQTKIERYESALFKFHRKISEEHIQNETLSAQIVELNVQIESLKNANPKIIEKKVDVDSIFDKMKSLLDISQKENREMHEQRESLVNIVKKQNIVIDQYEKLLNNAKMNNNEYSKAVQQRQNINEPISDDIDALYTVLGAISRLGSSMENIKTICEDSSMPIQNRIIKIFHILFEKQSDSKGQNTNPEYSESHERSLRLLAVLDDEMTFLLQLAQNKELQSIVFPNESKINVSFKQQLADHCSKIGEFIEETLPRVYLSSELDKIPHIKILDLLNVPNIQEKVTQVYDSIKNEESREVFQLYVSEAVVSSIMHKYAMECKMKLDSTRKKMDEMQYAVDKTEELHKKIQIYQEREQKMRTMLDSMFDTNPKTDFLIVFEAVIKYFKNQSDNFPIISDLKTAMAQTNREHSKEIDEISNKFKKDIKILQKKCKSLQKEADSYKNENNQIKTSVEEYQQKVKVLENQVTQAEKFYNEKYINCTREFEIQKKDYLSKIELFKGRLKERENEVSKFTNEIKALKSTINEYIEKNAKLENVAKESMSLVSKKTNELKSAYEKTIRSMAKKLESLSSLENENKQLISQCSNASNQNEKLKLENKTMAMLIKTNEEKWKKDMEKVSLQLSSQLTAVKHNFEANLTNISNIIESFSNAIGHPMIVSDNNEISTVLNSIVKSVTDDLKMQSIYSSFYKSLSQYSSILNLNSPEQTIDSIKALLDSNKALNEKVHQLQTKIQQDYSFIERAKVQDKEHTAKIIELKKWELWAKRQTKSNGEEISNDQMRRYIEEALWNNQTPLFSLRDPTIFDENDDQLPIKIRNVTNDHPKPRPKTLLPGIPPSD